MYKQKAIFMPVSAAGDDALPESAAMVRHRTGAMTCSPDTVFNMAGSVPLPAPQTDMNAFYTATSYILA
ncbi:MULTISPECIES: hypothetical protein [Tenebrionibacter/Tenebrionicola group]|uniref:Uncharacterized protein n=2 Tax=Tenebrionibacter/Tenebrionicola group TaxID=2969848 RepID=A0A8K0V2J3_9ENTR|nr:MULTISPECIES: hypothetical protein [Tenebrionibacter/Tenebrionicola group]MBK4714381.1 hypothetical protein [Tenebrionibacter intestinalis]MBV4414252.1 hypothetical protein [Tenebrionicola larvae]MBV5095212.1 hypothetical protein [Tenebrionicola larvae]